MRPNLWKARGWCWSTRHRARCRERWPVRRPGEGNRAPLAALATARRNQPGWGHGRSRQTAPWPDSRGRCRERDPSPRRRPARSCILILVRHPETYVRRPPRIAARCRPEEDLRRGRGRLGRRRRHGRARSHLARHESAAARSRPEAAHRTGTEVDAVAVRPSAARRDAARRATRSRSTSTPSASRLTPRDRAISTCIRTSQGWGGSDYSKNIVVDEKDHPYTGTNYAWVRARAAGRQDGDLGTARAAPLRLRFQGRLARRLRRGLADLLRATSSLTTTAWTGTWASPA